MSLCCKGLAVYIPLKNITVCKINHINYGKWILCIILLNLDFLFVYKIFGAPLQ